MDFMPRKLAPLSVPAAEVAGFFLHVAEEELMVKQVATARFALGRVAVQHFCSQCSHIGFPWLPSVLF
jgi:hypothetical protein